MGEKNIDTGTYSANFFAGLLPPPPSFLSNICYYS